MKKLSKKKPKLILASSSSRRAAILNQLDIPFQILESNYGEETGDGIFFTPEDVRSLAIKNAKGKALTVAKGVKEGIILGVDTLALYKNEVIGKPKDKKDAKRILKTLSGHMHLIFSGIVLVQKERGKVRIVSDCDEAKVYFCTLTDEEILEYVDSGEPLDKAGGYGAQEKGARFITRIDGDFYTVVGLPVAKLFQMAKKMGISL